LPLSTGPIVYLVRHLLHALSLNPQENFSVLVFLPPPVPVSEMVLPSVKLLQAPFVLLSMPSPRNRVPASFLSISSIRATTSAHSPPSLSAFAPNPWVNLSSMPITRLSPDPPYLGNLLSYAPFRYRPPGVLGRFHTASAVSDRLSLVSPLFVASWVEPLSFLMIYSALGFSFFFLSVYPTPVPHFTQ